MLKTTSDSAVLFKYGKIPEQIMKQSDWKSGCILGAPLTPPKSSRTLTKCKDVKIKAKQSTCTKDVAEPYGDTN